MSERLPVGETLNEAFQFGMHRWTTVLRIAWLPLLIVMAIMMGSLRFILNLEALQAETDPANFINFQEYLRIPAALAFLMMVGAVVLTAIVMSGVMASIYRLVALGEPQEGFFRARFDGPAIRVFWAQIIMGAVNYGFYGLMFLVMSLATGHSPGEVIAAFSAFAMIMLEAQSSGVEPSPDQLMQVAEPLSVLFLAGLVSVIPLIYINVRLSPFAPGSAAENRLLLIGAFNLTKGYFWKIFGVYFLLGLALMLLGIVFGLVMEIFELLSSLSGGGAGGVFALIGVLFGLIGFGATVLYQSFVLGVQLSMQAIIYRRLKTGA